MQIYCEYCEAPLKSTKKVNCKRRSLIKSPNSFKKMVCPSCGKKNFVKL